MLRHCALEKPALERDSPVGRANSHTGTALIVNLRNFTPPRLNFKAAEPSDPESLGAPENISSKDTYFNTPNCITLKNGVSSYQ